MTDVQSQLEAIFHADFIRKTEVLDDIAYWEDRVHFIANHAAQVIRAVLAEKERYEAENADLRADVAALREVLGDLLALVAYDGSLVTPHDFIRAMEVMIGTAPDTALDSQASEAAPSAAPVSYSFREALLKLKAHKLGCWHICIWKPLRQDEGFDDNPYDTEERLCRIFCRDEFLCATGFCKREV